MCLAGLQRKGEGLALQWKKMNEKYIKGEGENACDTAEYGRSG